jgi:hypothetical protein
MPEIYRFNVSALNANPRWYVLNYSGPNSPQADKNRTAVEARWGSKRAGAPAGYQLDEFPYASTDEGGRGAWGEMVPASENSLQGGLLGAFYWLLRKNNQKTFLVVPVPI